MFRKHDQDWEERLMDIESIPYDNLPEHAQDTMRAYIERGVPTGGFFKAVLSNDLMGAFNQADSNNVEHIVDYVHFLYNHAPAMCWKSPEHYKDWVLQGGYLGKYAVTE